MVRKIKCTFVSVDVTTGSTTLRVKNPGAIIESVTPTEIVEYFKKTQYELFDEILKQWGLDAVVKYFNLDNSE
jgi:hypothetical protein